MAEQWVAIDAWHIVREPDGRGGYITLCGKPAEGPAEDTYPAEAKTCESCLRLNAKGQGRSKVTPCGAGPPDSTHAQRSRRGPES